MTNLTVRQITRIECEPFIIDIHYAHRWCPITYAYGLFDSDELIGIVTYGTPPSSPLRNGIAGKENASRVLELNRLCLKYNRPNEASQLISKSLRLLPKGKIIISFADTEQDHIGFVYQASNFTYHGLSAKRIDTAIEGMEAHCITIQDEFRGQPNRAELIRKKYGDRVKKVARPRKHRYIYITGKKERKLLTPMIKYKREDYVKVN